MAANIKRWPITYPDAMAIIRRHQDIAPVQVIKIAEDLGINVYKASHFTDISGMIKLDKEAGGSSGYAIYVNGKHANTRRRFTIAHECAHFVLHRERIGDGIIDDALYRSGLSSREEAAANQLAADILMPWHLINAAMERGIETVESLALHFEVSRSAMSIRLGVPYETTNPG